MRHQPVSIRSGPRACATRCRPAARRDPKAGKSKPAGDPSGGHGHGVQSDRRRCNSRASADATVRPAAGRSVAKGISARSESVFAAEGDGPFAPRRLRQIAEGQILAGIFRLGIGQEQRPQHRLAAQSRWVSRSMAWASCRGWASAGSTSNNVCCSKSSRSRRSRPGGSRRSVDSRRSVSSRKRNMSSRCRQQTVGRNSLASPGRARRPAIQAAGQLQHSPPPVGQRPGEPRQQLRQHLLDFVSPARWAIRRARPPRARPASGRE